MSFTSHFFAVSIDRSNLTFLVYNTLYQLSSQKILEMPMLFFFPFFLFLRLSKANTPSFPPNLGKNICKIHKKFKIFVEKVVE